MRDAFGTALVHGIGHREAVDQRQAVTDADLGDIANRLVLSSAKSRAELAAELASYSTPELWAILGHTVRSADDWLLRARCLELLGLIAGSSDRETAEAIIAALTRPRDPTQTSPPRRRR